MASPAAVLDLLLTANTTQATAALAKTQGQLTSVASTSTKTSATMKKAMLGIGAAAVGAGVVLFKVGEEFDKAYDKIRTQTGATGKELGKLEKDFKNVVSNVPASFDDAATALAGLNQRLGLAGKPLERLTKQVLQLSKITDTDVQENVESVTRLFGDWSVKTKKQSETLDGLYRISQKTGTSVSDLARNMVQFGAPLRNLGVKFDFAAAMFGEFEKTGVNMSTVLSGMRLSVGNLATPTADLAAKMKELGVSSKDPQEAIATFMSQIEKAKTDSEAAGLAILLFGKRAGPDLADTIRGGKFELDDLMKTFHDGRDTISKAERSTRDFSEQWQIFTNNMMVALEPVATEVFKTMGDIMKDVTDVLSDPKLSGRQKFDAITQMVGHAIGDAAKKAAELAPTIVKGLVSGLANLGPSAFGLTAALWGAMGAKAGAEALGRRMGIPMGKGLGKGLIVGLLLSLPELLKEVTDWGTKNRFIIRQIGVDWGEWFVNALIDAVNFGIRQLNEAMDKANIAAFTGVDAPNIGEIGKVDFQGPLEQQRELVEKTKKNADAIRKNWRKGWMGLADDTDEGGRKNDQAARRWLGRFADDAHKNFETVGKDSDKISDEHLKKLIAGFQQTDTKGSRSIASLTGAVGSGMGKIGTSTNAALRALGLDPVNFKAAVGKVGNVIGKAATGQKGLIVPGSGSGDKVSALLEPGEVVLNRNAVSAMGGPRRANALNRAVPRFAGGGIVEMALGPYDIPPIQYDPNHAGGNSHLHLDFFKNSQTVAIGKRMQGMGWSIGEYSGPSVAGFGGLTTSHQSAGHYDGTAFDANTAQDESRSQVAAVARMLGGAGGLGAAVAEKIARVILHGPPGALRSAGQGALDKVRGAANRFLSKQSMKSTGEVGVGVGGAMSAGAIANLWRSVNGGLGDPGLMARIAMAESSGNPAAIGHDPGGTKGYGLWQITSGFHDDLIKRYNPILNPRNNALAAASIFRNEGTGAWAASGPWQKGGIIPYIGKFHQGGVARREGLAHVQKGESIGTPPVHVHIVANGGVEIEDVWAEIDGAKADIAEYTLREGGRNRARSRQLPGQAGRA